MRTLLILQSLYRKDLIARTERWILRRAPRSLKAQLNRVAAFRQLSNAWYRRSGTQVHHLPELGIRLEVNMASHFERCYVGDPPEPDLIEYFRSTVTEGQTVVDVGAFIGFYTVLFAKYVRARGQVYALEPQPNAFGRLERNVEINQLSNVILKQLAASNKTGRAQLHVDVITGSGAAETIGQRSSLNRQALDTGSEHIIQVQTSTLDDLLSADAIDLIKIDVEGAELEVLQGATKILRAGRTSILLELNTSTAQHACHRYLRQFGYKPSVIGKTSYAHHVLFSPEETNVD